MTDYDYDLFVIGGGSGGVRAARMAAGFGARVALCEERYLGGTCVNVGCIPKKLLVYGSHFPEECEDAAAYGWSVAQPTHDWAKLIANKDKEIGRLNGIYRNLLVNAGVEVLDGRGTLDDAHTVRMGERTFTARYIMVSTGGWPEVPEFPGRELAITSNEAFYLEQRPARILIAGGGYIAVEFAGIFNGFGSEVTLIHRGPQILRGFDDDVRDMVAAEMEKKGVTLRLNVTIKSIERSKDGLRATLSDGATVETDCVMCATGRAPNTAGLGLEALGVERNWRGGIVVNERYRSTVESIYAVGDVIDKVALTPVALAEGMAVARNLFGGQDREVDYENIPTAVFSQPPIGTVGLTEAEARTHHGEVLIFKSSFTPLKGTVSGNSEKTFMKMIVDKATDCVVGVHMVGADAGEIIQGVAVALNCGATKAQFDATIGIHPTSAEEFVTMRTPEPEPAQAAAG